MTEFETILEANSKAPLTLRRKPVDKREELFLDKVREVRVSLQNGLQTLVVLDHKRSFNKVFQNYSKAIALYAKNGLLTIKTVGEVTAEDLEANIIEIDKGTV